MTKRLHLVCNAHLDPVWLWEWQEGAAEAISAFRVAAELCEQFDAFVFNHNEVVLYQWVAEYEPALFGRIQKLVKAGKWHIMGGWYLQPDCNMPSGESFVRQNLLGRRYFDEHFGVRPTTAINFDPFGHTQGLVQIMAQAGYDSYLFCRPGPTDCPLPAEDFEWIGLDGSRIVGHRSLEWYNSRLGGAAGKVEGWLAEHLETSGPASLLLWGVGNHGGGPSRLDLENLQALIERTSQEGGEIEILHSTPEAYFQELRASGAELPKFKSALNAWAVGCYTSQIEVKQRHRLLENELFSTEKMFSQAALQSLLTYPHSELQGVMHDLALAQFHDILPGSSIQPVEAAALRLMDHGLEILSRLKTRAFFALASGQPKATPGTIPILVYNPQPYPVEGIFECEFQLADQNWKEEFSYPHLYLGDTELPSQAEKELSNINLDWRKRIAFRATLHPGQMNRFDCRLEVLPVKPLPQLHPHNGVIHFQTDELEVIINCKTGLVDRYRVNGFDFLKSGAFLPLVIEDDDDHWQMTRNSFRQEAGAFSLMEAGVGSRFSGVTSQLESVRVIEDGPVRSVVEVVLSYGHSSICQRYKLPRQGSELEVELTVFWNEKSRMLKLSVPTTLEGPQTHYLGQIAYGVEELAGDGREVVAQKWTGVWTERVALTCINDGTYGSDYKDGELRLSLLRSAGYSGHPILDRPIMSQDRYSSRIDQGERHFRFWFNAGEADQRRQHIDRESLAYNEKPFVLSFFPADTGSLPKSILVIDNSTIQLSAFKQAADQSGDYILRLFEPTGQAGSTTLKSEYLELEYKVELKPYEIKTLRLSNGTLREVGFLEI